MKNEQEENKKQTLSRMQALCSRSEKSTGEIREKLAQYPVSSEEAEWIIEQLKQEEFIDDKRYSEFFVRDKFRLNQWGKIKIKQALSRKGINNETMYEALDRIDRDEYFSSLQKMLEEKNRKLKESNIFIRKGKLFRFAAQKGFENDLIYSAIDAILED